MKVILVKDVPNLGRAGDIKTVSDGHARNFLIPKKLALPATSEVLTKVQKEEAEHQAKIGREHERFLSLKNKLQNKKITIKAKANKTNLFAAIHENEIAKALAQQLGIEINEDLINLARPVKTLGEHEIEIRFAKDLQAVVRLYVEQS